MPAINLSIAERKELRADAHYLHPVVFISSDGLSDNVLKEIDASLNAHGLIKIRVFSDDREQRAKFLQQICEQLNAAPIQNIGKLLIVWRPIPQKESFESSNPGMREVKFLKFSKRGGQRPEVQRIKLMGNERLSPGGKIKRVAKRKTSIKRTILKKN